MSEIYQPYSLQIGCAGALITYLNKHEVPNRDEGGLNVGPIAGVEMQSIGGGMYINSETLKCKPVASDVDSECITDIPRFISSIRIFELYSCS